jgi:hypothetical protein
MFEVAPARVQIPAKMTAKMKKPMQGVLANEMYFLCMNDLQRKNKYKKSNISPPNLLKLFVISMCSEK